MYPHLFAPPADASGRAHAGAVVVYTRRSNQGGSLECGARLALRVVRLGGFLFDCMHTYFGFGTPRLLKKETQTDQKRKVERSFR